MGAYKTKARIASVYFGINDRGVDLLKEMNVVGRLAIPSYDDVKRLEREGKNDTASTVNFVRKVRNQDLYTTLRDALEAGGNAPISDIVVDTVKKDDGTESVSVAMDRDGNPYTVDIGGEAKMITDIREIRSTWERKDGPDGKPVYERTKEATGSLTPLYAKIEVPISKEHTRSLKVDLSDMGNLKEFVDKMNRFGEIGVEVETVKKDGKILAELKSFVTMEEVDAFRKERKGNAPEQKTPEAAKNGPSNDAPKPDVESPKSEPEKKKEDPEQKVKPPKAPSYSGPDI